jgi:subtilase family serine protease
MEAIPLKFTKHDISTAARVAEVAFVESPSLAAVQSQSSKVHRPPGIPVHAKQVGHLATELRMNFVVALKLRDTEDMKQFVQSLYDSSSPDFRHFPKQAEFSLRFGPTAEQYHAVTEFLTLNGFVITHTYDSHLVVDVSGTVGDIECAFQVSLYEYVFNGQWFFAPDKRLTLPPDVAVLIQCVMGLDNLAKLQRRAARIGLPPTLATRRFRPAKRVS